MICIECSCHDNSFGATRMWWVWAVMMCKYVVGLSLRGCQDRAWEIQTRRILIKDSAAVDGC